MSKVEYLNYDENIDHLTIYKANEKIVSNIDIGLAILSLNKKKEIVGMELMGVHKNFKVPMEVLNNLKGCKVDIRYNSFRKFVVANVFLNYQGNHQSPLAVSSAMDLGKNTFNDVFACHAA